MNENEHTENIPPGTPWPEETEEKDYDVFIEILYELLKAIAIITFTTLLIKL